MGVGALPRRQRPEAEEERDDDVIEIPAPHPVWHYWLWGHC